MLLAAGCSGPEPLPAEDARAHYDQVRQDVVAAIGAEDLSLTVREEPLVGTEDGTCIYDPGSWEADGEAFTDADSTWQPLVDPVNEVLSEHGFDEVDEFAHTNGQAFGISGTDDHGLRLRAYVLEGNTVVSLHGAEIDDAGGCTIGV